MPLPRTKNAGSTRSNGCDDTTIAGETEPIRGIGPWCPRRQDCSRRGGSDRRRPPLGAHPLPTRAALLEPVTVGGGEHRVTAPSRVSSGSGPTSASTLGSRAGAFSCAGAGKCTSPAPAGPMRTRHHSVTCTYAFRRCMDPATNSANPPLISGRRDTPARSRSASPTHRRPAPRPAPSTGYAQQGSSLARRKPRSHPEGSTQRASWPPRPETGPGPGFDRARVVGCVPMAAGVVDGRR